MNSSAGDSIQQLENSIEALLETLHKTSVLLEDFRPENQTRLQEGFARLPEQLDAMAAAAATEQVRALTVPKQLFDFLDSGTNPDILTKQLIDLAVAESEVCKGKVAALADYHDKLQSETLNVFPELAEVLNGGAAGDGDDDNASHKKIKL